MEILETETPFWRRADNAQFLELTSLWVVANTPREPAFELPVMLLSRASPCGGRQKHPCKRLSGTRKCPVGFQQRELPVFFTETIVAGCRTTSRRSSEIFSLHIERTKRPGIFSIPRWVLRQTRSAAIATPKELAVVNTEKIRRG
jgi:hypothetical protein